MKNYQVTRAEIDLNALTNNLNVIKSQAKDKEIIAVVKANAYGHGISVISGHLHKLGVGSFAVSSVFEADEIREIVPNSDIIILGPTQQMFISRVVKNDYIQTITDIVHAKIVSEQSVHCGGKTRCHVKIDTGMTRLGIDNVDELEQIMNLSGLIPEGLFTHFSCADSLDSAARDFTVNQQSIFVEIASKYKLKSHSQNSGGVLNYSEFGGDMVRAGIALYGYCSNASSGLKPVMSLKSQIIQIREVGAGIPVSYGCTYVTAHPSRLAVIPVGYADGYSRLNSNKGKVMINGCLAPIRGRVCMDYIIVDVTDIDGVKVSDEVEVYSSVHKEIEIEHIAKMTGTIPYEVTCAVSARVPRLTVGD